MDIFYGLVCFAIRAGAGRRVIKGFRSLLAGLGLKFRSELAYKLFSFV